MGTASAKQIDFINTLIAERDIPEDKLGMIKSHASRATITTVEASMLISSLMGYTRKPAAPTTPTAWGEAAAALSDLDTQFYAIPASYVFAQDIDLYGNDYLFLRLRNYGGKRYLSRVFGAYGAPRYQRITKPATVLALAKIMATDEQGFAENWHKVSGNCGRCNATLTDAASREAGFGPDCLKVRASR